MPEDSQWVKIRKKSRNCHREAKALFLDGLSGLCAYLHQPRTFGLWTTRTPCGSIRKEQDRGNKEATGTGSLRKEGPGVGVSPVKGGVRIVEDRKGRQKPPETNFHDSP